MPSIFGKSGSTAGRAKTRHKSIRGTISAPIPIPRSPEDDEFPIRKPGSAKASVTADDEFPIRTPGAGIAIPLESADSPGPSPEDAPEQSGEREHGEQQDQQPRYRENSPSSNTTGEQEQVKVQASASTGPPASISAGSGGSRTDLARETRLEPPSTPPPAPPTGASTPVARPESRPASRSPHHRSKSPRKSSPLAVSIPPPERRATNPVLSTIRYSMISDAPSKQTTQSKDSPQRKKSTLRSALGRLFGRGKKKPGLGAQDASTGSLRESRPLASAQHRSDPIALGRPSNQRSPNRSASLPMNEFDRPLRSHSIGPDDIMAIESVRNSLQAEAAAPGSSAAGRRRAATTGGHTLLRPHLFNREYGAGLSPRPASAHGRASRTGGRDESDDPDEIGRAITSDSGGGLRRRSRSLSGLQDFSVIPPGGRRRSDEIRYWRASYDPGFMSPLSSNAQDDVDDTAMGDLSAPASPAVEKPPKTPPQPFNFGLLSKEMIGMKITHAADMDHRLDTLESRSLHLERVVGELCNAVPGFVPPPPPTRSATTTSQQHPPQNQSKPNLPPPQESRLAPSPPLISTSTQPKPQPTDHLVLINQLRIDLETERAQRLALEAQVKKLADRVNSLSTTMFAMVRGPSEARSQERLGTQQTVSVNASPSGKGASGLLTVPGGGDVGGGEEGRVSVFESDEDDDQEDEDDQEEGEGEGDDGDDAKTEVEEFKTPREERTPMMSFMAFGEGVRVVEDEGTEDEEEEEEVGGGGGNEEDDDDPNRKKAARTLSLGQLTLGKGQRVRV